MDSACRDLIHLGVGHHAALQVFGEHRAGNGDDATAATKNVLILISPKKLVRGLAASPNKGAARSHKAALSLRDALAPSDWDVSRRSRHLFEFS